MVQDQEHSQIKSQWGELHDSWTVVLKSTLLHQGFIDNHSLDIGPLSDLVGGWVTCLGLGNTQPIGCVILWVQIDGVQGYDEDQITLVVPDLSNFMAQVPVILVTPTIGHIMNVIKESEMDTLVTHWVNACVAYLLAVQQVTATLEDGKVATRVLDPTEHNEVIASRYDDTECLHQDVQWQ